MRVQQSVNVLQFILAFIAIEQDLKKKEILQINVSKLYFKHITTHVNMSHNKKIAGIICYKLTFSVLDISEQFLSFCQDAKADSQK